MLDFLRSLFPSRHASEVAAPPPVARAPYALAPGVPALQQDPRELRRRLLFGIAFAALLAGGSGYLAGRRGQDRGEPSPERRGPTVRR